MVVAAVPAVVAPAVVAAVADTALAGVLTDPRTVGPCIGGSGHIDRYEVA